MSIERINCGNANCFIISEGDNAILVDTAHDQYKDKILKKCKSSNIRLIVLTHGHFDHIQNASFLSDKLGVPIAMHKEDYGLIRDNMSQPFLAHSLLGKIVVGLSARSAKTITIEPFEPDVYLREGDSLKDYGISATVIELPGHTKGSIGLKVGNDIIVGDALMNFVRPTKSLLYGDMEIMAKSAKKISGFGNATVHFGHGKSVANRNW